MVVSLGSPVLDSPANPLFGKQDFDGNNVLLFFGLRMIRNHAQHRYDTGRYNEARNRAVLSSEDLLNLFNAHFRSLTLSRRATTRQAMSSWPTPHCSPWPRV